MRRRSGSDRTSRREAAELRLAPADGEHDRTAGVTRARALRAVSWSTAGTVVSGLIAFVRSLFIARLLRPEDFGLYGLALFAVTAVYQLTNPGLTTSALVERFDSEDEQGRYLDTLWTVGLARAIVLALLVIMTGPVYARFMGDPRLGPLMSGLSVWLLIGATSNPGLLLMQKRLHQRPVVQLRLGSDALGLLLTVGAAWLWPSPWALVYGFLASSAIGSAGSYLASSWRPRFSFDTQLFRRGIRLGKHVAIVSALAFVSTQVDNMIVGRVLGPAVLGVYLFAYRMASFPVDVMQSALTEVAVPTYSGLHQRGAQVAGEHFVRGLSIATTTLCALLLPVLLLRRELVMLIGGTHWLDAAPLIVPLTLLAVLRGAMIQLGAFLSGMKRFDINARCKIAEAIVFVPACFVGVHLLGATGAAWAGVASYALGAIVRSFAVSQLLSLAVTQIFGPWLRALGLAGACFATGHWLVGDGVPTLLVAPAMTLLLVALMLGLDAGLRAEARRLRTHLS